MNTKLDEDFNREEAGHIRTLLRRTAWLDRRLRSTNPRKGGAVFDQVELNALCWALGELGVDYAEADDCEELDEPPTIREPKHPESGADTYSRGSRGNRYYPMGSE